MGGLLRPFRPPICADMGGRAALIQLSAALNGLCDW